MPELPGLGKKDGSMNDTTRPSNDSGPVTLWLQRWRQGDREALAYLVAHYYQPLKQRAARYLEPGASVSPTALVHEWFLRVSDASAPTLHDRNHFLAVAALRLRRIAGHLRRRAPRHRLQTYATGAVSAGVADTSRRALEEALMRLQRLDPRCAHVFVLRHVLGLAHAEIVQQTGFSPATIKRELSFARAWLATQIRPNGSGLRE